MNPPTSFIVDILADCYLLNPRAFRNSKSDRKTTYKANLAQKNALA